MELKIVFTSQRLTSWEEVSEALSIASSLLLEEENDYKNRLYYLQNHGTTRKYLERKLKVMQKAREIIEALESPQVLPI